MSKKKHSKLSKQLKAQQLQQIAIGVVLPSQPTPAVATVVSSAAAAPPQPIADHHLNREITRTLISLAVVALLLFVAVLVDRRTGYFTTFGGWLFQALRLASK